MSPPGRDCERALTGTRVTFTGGCFHSVSPAAARLLTSLQRPPFNATCREPVQYPTQCTHTHTTQPHTALVRPPSLCPSHALHPDVSAGSLAPMHCRLPDCSRGDGQGPSARRRAPNCRPRPDASHGRHERARPPPDRRRPPSAVRRPPSAVHRSPLAVHRSLSTVRYPPSADLCPLSTARRPPLAVHRTPSTRHTGCERNVVLHLTGASRGHCERHVILHADQ